MITKEHVISLLFNCPSTEHQLGWNNALISLLKTGDSDTEKGYKFKDLIQIGDETLGFKLTLEKLDEIKKYILSGSILSAVKTFKYATGFGLKESKDAIERFRDDLIKYKIQ